MNLVSIRITDCMTFMFIDPEEYFMSVLLKNKRFQIFPGQVYGGGSKPSTWFPLKELRSLFFFLESIHPATFPGAFKNDKMCAWREAVEAMNHEPGFQHCKNLDTTFF